MKTGIIRDLLSMVDAGNERLLLLGAVMYDMQRVVDAVRNYSARQEHEWRCEYRTEEAGWKEGDPPVIRCECGYDELQAALKALDEASARRRGEPLDERPELVDLTADGTRQRMIAALKEWYQHGWTKFGDGDKEMADFLLARLGRVRIGVAR